MPVPVSGNKKPHCERIRTTSPNYSASDEAGQSPVVAVVPAPPTTPSPGAQPENNEADQRFGCDGGFGICASRQICQSGRRHRAAAPRDVMAMASVQETDSRRPQIGAHSFHRRPLKCIDRRSYRHINETDFFQHLLPARARQATAIHAVQDRCS